MAKRRRNKHKNKPQTSSQATTQQQGVAAPQPTNTGAQSQPKKSGVPLQTIEQKRAKHALDKIQTVGDISESKLSSYIVGMPAMILMSGFGQTCAFYVSKSNGNTEEAKAYQKVVDILWDWLGQGKHGDIFTGKSDLMTAITSCDATTYQLAQAESLAYLNWLKKFAKAYLKDDNKGDE